MGSVGSTSNFGSFLNRVYPEGLDLGRCQISKALGTWMAAPGATFRAGMLVMRDANGFIVPSDGSDVLGVAKWNKASSLFGVVVDEPIVLPNNVAVPLKHPNVSNFRLSLTPSGSALTAPTAYSLNATNGTVTSADADTTIADGATCYASYTFAITEADLLQLQGKNFFNTNDDVSVAEGRVTVITDAELLFTTQYDTAQVYTLTGTGSNLYADDGTNAGLFTNVATLAGGGGAKFVGRVIQVPTASDPFLGVRLIKQPIAAS